MRINSINNNYYNFAKQTSFRGVVNGTNYPDELIKEAEEILKTGRTISVDDYKKGFLECVADSEIQPLAWLLSPVTSALGSDNPVKDSRIAIAIGTLGFSELFKLPEASIRKIITNKKANEHVAKLKSCMIDLLKEQGRKGIRK